MPGHLSSFAELHGIEEGEDVEREATGQHRREILVFDWHRFQQPLLNKPVIIAITIKKKSTQPELGLQPESKK